MKFVPEKVSRAVASQVMKTQQSSPAIFFGVGVVGMIGTAVLASRATLRLEEVLETNESERKNADELYHSKNPAYSEADHAHDQKLLKVFLARDVIKLYAPAVALGVVSIACLAQSNRILNRRNVALTAAYTALDKGFREYRARVVDELGEKKDREFRYGTQEIQTVDEKTGKKSKKKTVVGNGETSVYARLYDETNPNWQGIPEIDRIFLDAQQRYANEKLRAKGHLILNDVYRSLGMPDSPEGCVVGWKWNGGENSDNFVDFGMGNWPSSHDYIHAREFGLMLDFNVDGIIYDQI